jgi:hypothetical protein
MVKISIIILTYNSSQYIEPLLNSLVKKYSDNINAKELEIIVADNKSLDDTLEKANKYKETIKITENGGNFGFAKGNNLGVKKASGEFLVFLNPDAKFIEGDLFDAVSLFDDDSVGIIGGKIISLDGKKELSCGKFYNPLNILLLTLGLEESLGVRFAPSKKQEVDFVSGGFLFIRKKLFERLNGFDENYFMYVEDSDLCYQAKKKGFRVLYSNKATIQHVGQGSSNRTFAIVNIYKGLLYYSRKNGGKVNYLIVKLMLVIKARVLVLVGRVRNNKYLVDTYTEAVKALTN